MADLIDRDAVIRITAETGAIETQRRVKELQAVNRWIPCSERMPVLYVPVIILTADDSCAIAHVTENEDEYLWFGDGGHYSKDYVRFWMPRPEPPNEW